MPQPSRYVTARLSIRRGTKDQWESENTVLLEGEPGWELDTQRLKIGDGVSPWVDLNYFKSGDSEAAGSVIHDSTILPEHVNSVSSAVEYFGAKFKVYDEQGVNEFVAGLTGGSPKYVLTLAAGTGGVASHNGADNVFNEGEVISISATAFTGYEFDYWQGVDSSNPLTNANQPTTQTQIFADTYIRANFRLTQ